MQDYGSEGSARPLLEGAPRIAASLGLLAAALAITVPTYGQWLSGDSATAYKFGLALLWGVLAIAATGSPRLRPFRAVLLSLFGVSLGLALASIVGSDPLTWLGWSAATPRGAAAEKILSEVLPVSAAILIAAFLARSSPESLGLRGGRVWLSLGLGLLASVPLLVVFAIDPAGDSMAVLALPAATLIAWLPWLAVFSIANGFMEELWFRGSWFSAFRQLVGSPAAMHVTSVAFCAVHVIVYWSDLATVAVLAPIWLFMGYAYALIIRKTGSLWGVVLAHAIADVLYMYVYFTKV